MVYTKLCQKYKKYKRVKPLGSEELSSLHRTLVVEFEFAILEIADMIVPLSLAIDYTEKNFGP